MNRDDAVRELALLCRRHHMAALWVVAYLTTGLDEHVLEQAVEGAREVSDAWVGRSAGHLAAYQERWGRLPDRG